MRLPPSVLKRGPRWDRVFWCRGGGQYPGGNTNFSGQQPPSLKVPCEDGTVQSVYFGVPMRPDAVCYWCAKNPCECKGTPGGWR